MNKVYEKLKEWIGRFLLAGIFVIILYLIANYSFVVSLFSLIILNVGMDYYWDLHIQAKKIISIRHTENEGKNFNSDYFDLYWNFSKSRIQLLWNIELLILSLAAEFITTSNIFNKISQISGACFAGIILSIIICMWGHNNRVLEDLINHKRQEYIEYSEEERNILSRLK